MGLELKNVTKKFKTIEGERVIFENLNIHFPDYGLLLQGKVDVENQHFYN